MDGITSITRAAVTVACLGMVLAGCGGTSSGAATDPGDLAAAGSTAAAAASGSGSDPGAAPQFTDAEACAWLKENLPKWADITSEVGVQAQIVINLASFFEDHGGLDTADGGAFDAATLRGCKAEHDEAVTKAGITGFGAL